MKKRSFRLPTHCSVSLTSLIERRKRKGFPLPALAHFGFRQEDPDEIRETDRAHLLIAHPEPPALLKRLAEHLHSDDKLAELEGGFFTGRLGERALQALVKLQGVRVQTKKQHASHLQDVAGDMALVAAGKRTVEEDGSGVLIGVVDTGFDLSHPGFRDRDGKLRVEALLDQQDDDKEYTTGELEKGWSDGSRPGKDDEGHGTHVANIAGGSAHEGYEGIAPGARFLLVRSDMVNLDEAVYWVLRQAQGTPCVVNLSVGHHLGAHDGSDGLERLLTYLAGAGKVLVASAGNERQSQIHVGGEFFAGQREEVTFDLLRQSSGKTTATLGLWYADTDDFEIELVTPTGQILPVPAVGTAESHESATLDIEVARQAYAQTRLTKVQVQISLVKDLGIDFLLQAWRLRLRCRELAVGRIDGWFQNSGYAAFRSHPLVDGNRTVALPATASGCLAAASHVSRNGWEGDLGKYANSLEVPGRISSFSGRGPSRDGGFKPDISAPGQYVTSALAEGSAFADWSERTLTKSRLMSLEGTSMAAPAVTGLVALLLQKKGTLDADQLRQVFLQAARRDAATGSALWTPDHGYGKVDVAAMLAAV